MKKTVKTGVSLLLTLLMIFSFAACGKKEDTQTKNQGKDDLWQNATYTENKEFGNGKTTVQVEVKVGDRSVTFTVKTDKKTLGDALGEHNLIDGEKSEYGMYVKVVNGITADYDKDKAFWSFCKNGEMMTTGIDSADIADGEHYEIIYSK